MSLLGEVKFSLENVEIKRFLEENVLGAIINFMNGQFAYVDDKLIVLLISNANIDKKTIQKLTVLNVKSDFKFCSGNIDVEQLLDENVPGAIVDFMNGKYAFIDTNFNVLENNCDLLEWVSIQEETLFRIKKGNNVGYLRVDGSLIGEKMFSEMYYDERCDLFYFRDEYVCGYMNIQGDILSDQKYRVAKYDPKCRLIYVSWQFGAGYLKLDGKVFTGKFYVFAQYREEENDIYAEDMDRKVSIGLDEKVTYLSVA